MTRRVRHILNFSFGFRKGYSCQTTLLRMIQEWKSGIDNGNFVGSNAFDLSKTFDCLPHGFLMVNLHAYGVEVSACKVLCSYLHDRHHSMKMCDVRSDWWNIEKCVTQGSIVGPLLFNIFINDVIFIDNNISIYNYADDNCIWYAHPSIDQIIGLVQ